MKFYIISLALHLIFIFFTANFLDMDLRKEPKNIVVYLNKVNIEGKGEFSLLGDIDKKEIVSEEKIEEKIKKIQKSSKVIKNKSGDSKKKDKKIENRTLNSFRDFIKDGKGTYIGDEKLNQGIGYKLKKDIYPDYPEMAKKMGLKKEVLIQTKFLVGLDGKIEEIIFIDNFTKYGFQKEVERALKQWEFEPIFFNGKNIKMYFYKDFRFNVKK